MSANNTKGKLRALIRVGFIVAVIALILAARGITSRMHAKTDLIKAVEQSEVLPVTVVIAKTQSGEEELTLPGSLQAFTETPIYARTNGYLKKWYVDIGAHVKQGQRLADIDTPELDQEIKQAKADLKTAEANYKLAQITATRWKNLLPTNAVSKQDVDNKISDAEAKQTVVASARANLQRLEALEQFKRIVSPLDGVVTVRNTDIGDLIDAGTGNGAAKELFHVAAMKRLRLYVQVPEIYAEEVKIGGEADLNLREHPATSYQAKITNTAHAINPSTHTLLVELALENNDEALMPGGFVEVHFKLSAKPNSFRIPANTLAFGAKGMQVATINASNKILMHSVTMGRDFGGEVEIVSGLKEGDVVVLNPTDSITDGQKVRVLRDTDSGAKE
jgi:RND family efflux transporter MFP subunit